MGDKVSLVTHFEDEFKNRGNHDIVDELMSQDFVHHLPYPGLPAGPGRPEHHRSRVHGFSQAIIDSGEMVGGDSLEAADAATSVQVRDGRVATTPGPFAAPEGVLSGYYLVEVKDLGRALELAAQIPDARTGVVEVRPLGSIPT
jgi:hypothetical protein